MHSHTHTFNSYKCYICIYSMHVYAIHTYNAVLSILIYSYTHILIYSYTHILIYSYTHILITFVLWFLSPIQSINHV